ARSSELSGARVHCQGPRRGAASKSPSHFPAPMRHPLLCVPLLCLAIAAHAQVPRGWAVASNFANTAAQVGGLTMFHPLVPGASVPITGALPAAITGAGLAPPCGAMSVLVDESGGLVVGTHASTGQPLQVFLLTLSGSTV